MVRVTLVATNTECRLVAALESVIEATQDFTDSAYTSHKHRQQIVMCCEQLRHELSVVLRAAASLVSLTLSVSPTLTSHLTQLNAAYLSLSTRCTYLSII